MGCWNGSCSVSGMSLKEGQRAVALPIACDRNGVWSLTMLPIYGTYNDYGGLQDIEPSDFTRWLEGAFAKRAQRAESIESIPEDSDAIFWIGPDADELEGGYTIENIVRYMERERAHEGGVLQVEDFSGYWNRLTLMLVEREVFEHLTSYECEEGKHRRLYMEKRAEEVGVPLRDEMAELKAAVSMARELLSAGTSNLSADELLDRVGRMPDISDMLSRILPFGSSMETHRDIALHKSIYIRKCPDEGSALLEYSRFSMFINNFENLRKTIGPALGAGSQDDNLNDILALNKVVESIIQKVKEQEDEDDYE